MKLDEKKKELWYKPALEMFARVIGWIAVPIISALFLGNWLDERYDSEPKYLLICVGVAFILTNVGLVLNVVKTSRKMESEINKETKDTK
jgi:hypothetical protein